ncbi:MAG: hypothetical protein HOQ24_18465 [Mycobacteriaceae bacterium]|nr:hypothetical protein [Mycobacteriaceae bacterium]
MSETLRAYAVDLALLGSAVNSGDKALMDELSVPSALGRYLQEQWSRDWDATPDQVLGYLILGEGYVDRLGPAYIDGLEYLCEHFGEALDNCNFSSMRGWLSEVQKVLNRADVPFDMADLLYDWPSEFDLDIDPDGDLADLCVGSVERHRIPAILQALLAVDWAAPELAVTGELRQSVEELMSWFDICARTNCDLVTFL